MSLSENTSDNTQSQASLSALAITLLKGVIYREEDEARWGHLLRLQNQVKDYVSVLGLLLMIDQVEGYAYLRSMPETEEAPGATALPRLIARRALPFHVSLLLALLRQQLVKFDAIGGETRLILSRDDLASMLQTFLPESNNEVRQLGQIETYIRRVTELGFLRPMSSSGADASNTVPRYEVRRILKAYIDAEWLATLDERLESYLAHARHLEQVDLPQAEISSMPEPDVERVSQLFPDYASAGLTERE